MNKKYLYIGLVALVVVIGGTVLFVKNKPSFISQRAYVRSDIAGLPEAKLPETIELKNGDTYNLSANYVKKAINGTEYRMLAYNGSIPGPEIHVQQGAEVTINFKNNTDMPALLHSHGVRVDNAFDGSQLQQKDIAPGQSFSYKMKFPDAGVFWYHPHVNEVYGQGLGLYGAFIVKSLDANHYPQVNKEHTLFLSDLPISNGTIALQKDGTDKSLMGHFGNVMLINGQENYVLTSRSGEVMRLNIVNASNTRPYNFAIAAGTRMKLIGGDSGAYEKASWQDSVILGPSERATVDVMLSQPGTYDLQNKTPDGTAVLGKINVAAGKHEPSFATQFNTLQENKEVFASIDPFRNYFDTAPDKKLTLSLDFSGMMAGHMQSEGMNGMQSMDNVDGMHNMRMDSASENGIEWDDSDSSMQMMNNMASADNTKWKLIESATGKSNMDIAWTFKKNQPVKIEIYNDLKSMHPMQHPIHFHGQRFLVLSINGVKQTNLVWKDTVFVPAGAKVDILLDPSNPGTWMAHCHISEHLVAGMVMKFIVE